MYIKICIFVKQNRRDMNGNFSDNQKKLAKELIKNNYSIKEYNAVDLLVLKKGKTQIKFLTPKTLKVNE